MAGFDFAPVLGIGRMVHEQNQKRDEFDRQQQLIQEQEAQHNFNSAVGLFHDTAAKEDAPPETRDYAARAYLDLVSRGHKGVKPKEIEQHWMNIGLMNMKRRKAELQKTLGVQASNLDQTGQMANQLGDAQAAVSPMAGALTGAIGGALQHIAKDAPTTAMPADDDISHSAFYTPEERTAQALSAHRGQLELNKEYSTDKYTTIGPGAYALDTNTGQIINGPPAKPEAKSDFEGYASLKEQQWVAAHPNEQMTPEVRMELWRAARREFHSEFSPAASTEPIYPVMQSDGTSVIYTPRSQAIGKPAPKTLYDPQGVPHTGGTNLSTSPPPEPSQEQQNVLSGTKMFDDQLQGLQHEVKGTHFGPIAGRVKFFLLRQGGGVGLSPQEKKVVVRMSNLFATKAFAEGGKQLTGPEREIFEQIMPSERDTLPTIATKIDLLREFNQQKLTNTIDVMSWRKRMQLRGVAGGAGGGSVLPSRPDGVAPTLPAQRPNAAKSKYSGMSDAELAQALAAGMSGGH